MSPGYAHITFTSINDKFYNEIEKFLLSIISRTSDERYLMQKFERKFQIAICAWQSQNLILFTWTLADN